MKESWIGRRGRTYPPVDENSHPIQLHAHLIRRDRLPQASPATGYSVVHVLDAAGATVKKGRVEPNSLGGFVGFLRDSRLEVCVLSRRAGLYRSLQHPTASPIPQLPYTHPIPRKTMQTGSLNKIKGCPTYGGALHDFIRCPTRTRPGRFGPGNCHEMLHAPFVLSLLLTAGENEKSGSDKDRSSCKPPGERIAEDQHRKGKSDQNTALVHEGDVGDGALVHRPVIADP